MTEGGSVMRIIMLGAPGAGKGTISKLLSDFDGSVQISTGDILRGAVKAGTDLGKKAKSFMESGALVPDELIMEIMEVRLKEPDCAKGFILDGFPRTIPQADALKALINKLGIKMDGVINLAVPTNIIMDRLTTRRTCNNADCQEIYNVKTKPSKVEGKCDKCGSPIIQRADETEEAIKERLTTYNEKTAPLINYYEKEGLLKTITSLDINQIVADVKAALKK
jgi:adenylate kinase